MFNISLSVFDDLEENPKWNIEDDEAIAILDFEQKLTFSVSTYDDSDNFEDNMPIGYQGFSITDEETGIYWRLKGNTIFRFDTKGVFKAEDEGCSLEYFLRDLVKKRNNLWYELSKSTKCVEPEKD